MKREELIAMGVSEDIVDKIIAEHGKAIQKANAKADLYKADAQKAEDLQRQLDEINNQSLSDLEKANNRIAELEKAQAIATQKNTVVEKFKVTSEQANQIVKEDGTLDYDVLGQIISDKEAAAATAKEQEIANNATNPGGGGAGGAGKEKSKAEQIATNLFGGKKQGNDVLSHYK